MSEDRDRYLGMDRQITRREFINGAAVVVGGTLLAGSTLTGGNTPPETQNESGYDPPIATGLRGSHPGSFETAHSLRDGVFWSTADSPVDTKETYDLVIVGAGISGLSAAHFFASEPANRRGFCYWRITTTSEGMPSATSFTWEASCSYATAGRFSSTVRRHTVLRPVAF